MIGMNGERVFPRKASQNGSNHNGKNDLRVHGRLWTALGQAVDKVWTKQQEWTAA